MRISQLHGQGRPVFSFEFFPPKTDQGAENLMRAVADLKEALEPDFVSVTNGAGGTTRQRTLEVVTRIQSEVGLTAMAHLTCVGATEADICEEVGRLVGNGIDNILALRGDIPKGESEFKAVHGGFSHATDLIRYLEDNYQVDVGAACYPEVHPESTGSEDDLRWTREKVDRGAQFLITQLFFDNDDYFAYVELSAEIDRGSLSMTYQRSSSDFARTATAFTIDEVSANIDYAVTSLLIVGVSGEWNQRKAVLKVQQGNFVNKVDQWRAAATASYRISPSLSTQLTFDYLRQESDDAPSSADKTDRYRVTVRFNYHAKPFRL